MIKKLLISIAITFASSTGVMSQTYINFNVNQLPLLTASAGSSDTICIGGFSVLNGNASGGNNSYNYSWSPSGSLSSATIANPTATPTSTTTYYLTVNDGNMCSVIDSVTIVVETCVAVNPIVSNEQEIIIYPNPNNGNFTVITGTSKLSQLQIKNILGEIVLTQTITTKTHLVDASQLPKGIYTISLQTENGKATQKIIIQ